MSCPCISCRSRPSLLAEALASAQQLAFWGGRLLHEVLLGFVGFREGAGDQGFRLLCVYTQLYMASN